MLTKKRIVSHIPHTRMFIIRIAEKKLASAQATASSKLRKSGRTNYPALKSLQQCATDTILVY